MKTGYDLLYISMRGPVKFGHLSPEVIRWVERCGEDNYCWAREWSYHSPQGTLSDYVYGVYLRNPEDAVAFKLKFGL